MSHWSGSVDWAALRDRYGITFGAAKATEGVSFTDSEFPVNWKKLAGAGLVRMAYHYAHPANHPVEEADHFLGYVALPAPLQPTDLFVLDLETGDGLDQDTVNDWAKAWAARVTEVINRRPVLYCGHAYMENQTGVGLNGPFSAWWYPRYPDKYADQSTWPLTFDPVLPSPNAWGGPPDFWQFSQSFPSPYGGIDANVYDGTLDQLRALNQEPDVELTDRINFLKSDGTRTWAGNIIGVDDVSVGGALGYAAASLYYLNRTIKPALDGLPDLIATRLDNLADPTEVRAAVDAAINDSGLKGLLPGV